MKRRKAKEERVAEDLLGREEQEIKEQEMEDLKLLDEAADSMELGETFLHPPPRQQEVKESREIASALLEEKLEDQAHLVTRYLHPLRLRKNHMVVPNTAAESLRFDVSPAVFLGILKSYSCAKSLSEILSAYTCFL